MSGNGGDSSFMQNNASEGVELTTQSKPAPAPRSPPPPRSPKQQPPANQAQQQQPPPQPQSQNKPTQDTKPKGLPYPRLPNGKYDYSKSLAQLKYPEKQFDSDVTICYRDVSVTVNVPQDQAKVRHVFTPLVDAVDGIVTCGKSCRSKELYRIKDMSGVIRPGETTLVLTPPGMGKSTFLKALANRVALHSGRVAYNGRDVKQAEAEGCDLKKYVQYVDQVDTHLPTLTVHETLDFSHKLTSVEYNPQKVEDAITMLGLEECRDTILGSATLRGVSGGQKKRVTTGELLVSDAPVLFLDEFSNGLDSSTSVDIMVGLKKFCLKYNSSVVATLQQPTPELFALFDRIIILRDGQVVFHGPTDDVLPFFEAMGYKAPDDVDTADFLIDCLSVPRNVILRQREADMYAAKKAGKTLAQYKQQQKKAVETCFGPLNISPQPCITTEEMVEFFHTTPQWGEIQEELDRSLPSTVDANGKTTYSSADISNFKPLLPTEKAKRMYSAGYRLPIITLIRFVLARQFTLFLRGTDTLIPRIVMATFMSLIYGSLYYGVGADDFILRLASLVIAITQVAFGNFIEIPISCQATRVVMKQLAARFYPAWIFIFASAISGIPAAMMEGTIYGVFLYFMTNAVRLPLEFFTFWVTLITVSFQLGVWFRCLSAVGGDEQSSQSLAGPSTGVFTIFGGLFISRSSIPDFMIWLYWISPFSWAVRGLANNEFLSSRYDRLIVGEGGKILRQGNVYLQQIDMYIGSEWILWGILYLFGLAIVTMFVHSILLNKDFYEESIGTRRSDEEEVVDGDADDGNNNNTSGDDNDDALLKEQVHANAIRQAELQHEQSRQTQTRGGATSGTGTRAGGASSAYGSNALRTLREALPFVPAWLSFSDVKYTVKVKNDAGEMVDRVLLNNVCGYAQPGKMLALMGASGAGKTTLLDVLAGLKNTGVVEGKIMINGQPTTPELIATVTAYVEQFHTLFPYSTVRETLEFAAQLRLPGDISNAVKSKIVDEILDILELTPMSNYIVGNAKIQSLSPAQCKRLSIGLELVANPSILFLDEPTTGLDSRSAQTVMMVAKRIARSGRAIIVTIHQPSAELFYLFDRLLLLGAGGFQIYHGDLGRRGAHFVQYLQQCPGVEPIKPRINPASWMLENLGVGVAAEKGDQEEKMNKQNTNDPRFVIQDEPEWASMEPAKRTVQRFKKIYLQSAQYEKTRRRLDILESIETIDPNDEGAIQRHKEEAERAHQVRIQQTQGNNNAKDDEVSKTTLPQTTVPIVSLQKPGLLQQFLTLYPRNFMAYYRNPPFLYARGTVIIVLSIIFGLIYLQLKVKDIPSATSLIGAIFMGSIFSAVVHATTATPTFFEMRPTFYREKAANYYKAFLWGLCQLTIELIWMIPGTLCCALPVYWMVGLRAEVGPFFSYLLITYELILVYVSIAMFFSSLAPSSAAANVLQGAFMSFQSAVGGVAITWPNVPRGYRWLYRMLPGAAIFEALIMVQVDGYDGDLEYFDGTNYVTQPIKEYVSNYLGWEFGHTIAKCLWALLFIGVCLVSSFVFTTFVAHNKR